MKTIMLVVFIMPMILSISAQSNDPYQPFGHSSAVNYEGESADLYTLKNIDTLSNLRTLVFDFQNQIVYKLDKGDSIIGSMAIYNNEQLRWLSVDPATNKYPDKSPYNFCSNNPLNRIDADGRGDFYSQAGKKLGTDGNNDGKIYVVTDNKVVGMIRKNTKDNVNTQVNDVQASIVQLPSAEVRQKIGAAVDRSNNPTKDDKQGGFHEEGGVFGTNTNGDEKVVDAKPGKYENPAVAKKATVDVFDAANPSEEKSIANVEGTYHIHPSGSVTPSLSDNNNTGTVTVLGPSTTYSFVQPPSDVDVGNAKDGGNTTGYNIVVGAADKTVYIFGSATQNQPGKTYQATFPLDKFKSIGNTTTPK